MVVLAHRSSTYKAPIHRTPILLYCDITNQSWTKSSLSIGVCGINKKLNEVIIRWRDDQRVIKTYLLSSFLSVNQTQLFAAQTKHSNCSDCFPVDRTPHHYTTLATPCPAGMVAGADGLSITQLLCSANYEMFLILLFLLYFTLTDKMIHSITREQSDTRQSQ